MMRRVQLLRAVVAAGAIVILGLTACDGGSDPEPTGSGTESPTLEAPEVHSPEPQPAIMRDDVHGAKAAASYFTNLFPYVYQTGDLTSWEELSQAECVFCQDVIDDVTALYDSGGSSTGGEITIELIEGRDPQPDGQYFRVDVTVDQDPSVETTGSGDTVESDGGIQTLVYAVEHVGDGWQIRGVQVDQGAANE